MADFDPDKYLQESALAPRSGFDPDAYLGGSQAKDEAPGKAITALEQFGRGATFGFLPELQALVGSGLGLGTFEEERRKNIERQKAQSEERPILSAASNITGAIPTLLAPGAALGRAAQLGGRIGQTAKATQALGQSAGQVIRSTKVGRGGLAATGGGLFGFLDRPESELEQDGVGISLMDRFGQAKTGAALGAGFQFGGEALAKGAKVASEKAPELALRSLGLKKSDINKIIKKAGGNISRAKEKINELGRLLLEKSPASGLGIKGKPLVQSGDTIETISSKLDDLMGSVGSRIGSLNDSVNKTMSDDVFIKSLNSKQINALDKTSLNPSKLADEFVSFVKGAVAGTDGAAAKIAKAQSIADDLLTVPSNVGDIEGMLAFRRSVDALTDFSATEGGAIANTVRRTARKFLQDKIMKRVNVVSKLSGSNTASQLKEANKLFSKLSDLQDVARSGSSSVLGNNIFGLRSTIMATGGDDLLSKSGLGIAAELSRRYGLPMAARSAQSAGRLGSASLMPGSVGLFGGLLSQEDF